MGSPRAILAVAVLAACGAAFFLLRGRSDGPTAGAERGQGSGPRGPLAVDGAPPRLAAGPRVPKDATDDLPETPAPTAAEPATPEELDPADRPADWPTTVADGCRTLRLRVRCVDAITGEPVAARWRLGKWSSAPPLIGLEAPGEKAGPPRPWLDSRWRAGDVAAAVLVPDGGPIDGRIEVSAPRGYAPAPPLQVRQPVARDVADLIVTVALSPAIDLVVTFCGPDGAPATGARLVGVTIAREPVVLPWDNDDRPWDAPDSAEDAADAQGVLRIPGLPFVPGAEVRATVVWLPEPPVAEGSSGAPSLEQEVTEVEAGPHPVVARMPVRASPAFTADVRLAGPTRSAALARMRERAPSDAVMLEEDVGEAAGPADPAKVGRIRVRVRGTDGEPLACASVYCANSILETDAEGRAELGDVPAGEHGLWVFLSGGFRWFSTVAVEAGALVDVELREPAAGRLDVEVVDEDGRPCPLASVRVAGAARSATYDVEDGVQRLDDLTDASGKRSFRRVAPGEVSVTAGWRGKAGEAKVVVEERGRVTARIVVR